MKTIGTQQQTESIFLQHRRPQPDPARAVPQIPAVPRQHRRRRSAVGRAGRPADVAGEAAPVARAQHGQPGDDQRRQGHGRLILHGLQGEPAGKEILGEWANK